MNKLLGIFLLIILDSPSFLCADASAEGELLLPIGTRQSRSDLRRRRENLWLKENGEIGYLQDHVKNTEEYPPSRLLSSLINDFKGFGKSQHPEIQSSQQLHPQDFLPGVENQHQQQEGGEGETEGSRQELGKQKEHYKPDIVEYEEQPEIKDSGHYEEEYRKRHEEKYDKSGVHLFGLLELRQQETLEQFRAHDLQRTRVDYAEGPTRYENPRFPHARETASTEFSYIHPEEWALNSPECSGRLQSPVNFDSDKLVGLDLPSSLIWTGYWNQPQNMTIADNGHSVELKGTWDTNAAPFISGGPLVGEYVFAQLHFHWGPKDSVGSEHTIDNKSFPMEMHMVHYKRDYQTFKEALKHNDGLAVIAFLFEVSETFNFGISLLEDSLTKIQNKPKIGIPVKPYPLAFLHTLFQEDYASYIGSLTTPPCREIVTWLVSASPLHISRRQLDFFRKISNKWPEKENYRPRQALNGRNLYYVAH